MECWRSGVRRVGGERFERGDEVPGGMARLGGGVEARFNSWRWLDVSSVPIMVAIDYILDMQESYDALMSLAKGR